MKYNVPDFPLEDFTRADNLVRATILSGGKVQTWNSIRRVTTDLQEIPKTYRDKVARELDSQKGLLRAACNPSPYNDHEFDIWFNPEVVGPTQRFHATVLHELCHGYRDVWKGHDDQWRRLHARVLFHYHYTVHSIDHWPAIVDLANWSYTKRGKTESTGDFLKRIAADKEKWIKQAEEDQQRVNDVWCSMMTPGWTRNTPTHSSRRPRKLPGT